MRNNRGRISTVKRPEQVKGGEVISTDHRKTAGEWLQELGAGLRITRIQAGLTQQDLARRADISWSAVKNLESGRGANLSSLVKAIRALGREDWLAAIAPPVEPGFSPMQLLRDGQLATAGRRRFRPPSR
jgi:DNA-binding XRE family transcriptional regulator